MKRYGAEFIVIFWQDIGAAIYRLCVSTVD